jgi:hypothetical protein
MDQTERNTYKVDTLLDVMRVPAAGDPLTAVVTVDHSAPVRDFNCDILVVGGGLGGVAAAWAAARHGRKVCLLEETDWLGGQMTSQGVSALDEHEHIEQFGGTRSYYKLRETIRDYYRGLISDADRREPLNPGDCWVSRLAFEPSVAVGALGRLLGPEIEAGRLQVFLRTKAVETVVEVDRVVSLKAVNLDDGTAVRFSFEYVLDATELGGLLPLTGTEYTVGAESVDETGEPHAQPGEAKAHCVQSCTYTFAMERRPEDEDNTIEKPDGYARYREAQPYSLRIHVHGGEIYGEESGWLDYHLFDETPGTKGPLWRYRRLVDAQGFRDHYENDATMFNWPGTDYRDMPLVDQAPEDLARALQDAKKVSLGFAYWLQTEAVDVQGRAGNSNILLRPDVMGSSDGLSKYPYIREGRRIKALTTVVEQHVSVAHQPGPRAAHFDDSVGIGWYPIDIHQAGEGDIGISTRTKPFQIPLGSLIPVRTENLIASNKNIGTTHITNGCYRLHPVEWNIGEAAGLLASFALDRRQLPRTIHASRDLLRAFQRELVSDGVPLCWLVDVPVESPEFAAVQRLVMAGGYGGNEDVLRFNPESLIDAAERGRWLTEMGSKDFPGPCGPGLISRAEFAKAMVRP